MRKALLVTAVLAAAAAATAATADAQRGGRSGRSEIYARCTLGSFDRDGYYMHPYHKGNIPYDGRFTFARVQYTGAFACASEGPGWAHDFPDAEINFMLILRELTIVRPHMERFNILRLDSPELFKYPALYFSEPYGWNPSAKEMAGIRNYLLKGGFIVFDDMPANQFNHIAYYMKEALPESEILPLPLEHRVFDTFFHITEPWISGSGDMAGGVDFYAIFQDNDPEKRVMVVFNYNNDLGERWQFSPTGINPINVTNESYKLGINYYLYALTH